MGTLLVTGGCGFIGSNFIRYVLDAEPDVARRQLRRPHLRRQPRQPRRPRRPSPLPLRPGRHHRPRRRPRRHRPASMPSSTSRPRATSIAASTTPARSSAPTSWARRSCSTPPATARCARFVQVSTDEVYGSLGPTGLFTETTPLAPNSPYAASKAAADLLVQQLRPHLRPARRHHALLEQLRAVPVPREADPAVHHATCCATSRCRSTATACRSATGSTSATTAAASGRVWQQGRAGEVYNIGGRCETDQPAS